MLINPISLAVAVDLDAQKIELRFGAPDKTETIIQLPGRGILDLEEEIAALLAEHPEIRLWKSARPN